MPYYREKGPGVQGKGGQNTGTGFTALRLEVVLYLLNYIARSVIGWVLNREGVNREKLTVKKIINKEMFFFSRLCPL